MQAGKRRLRLTLSTVRNQPEVCTNPFSLANFFNDCPWLNVPFERQAIMIGPLHPRGGLLGGAPEEKKLSKLQALAAARKKKGQEQKDGAAEKIEKPMTQLSLQKGETPVVGLGSKAEKGATESSTASKQPARGFPLRKRKDSNPHERTPKAVVPQPEELEKDDVSMRIPPVDQAEPSAFANTMFSSATHPATDAASLFTLPYVAEATILTDPFSGPSPDDIVLAAQSKGSAISSKAKSETNPV